MLRAGTHNSSVQKNFREQLIKDSGAAHPNPAVDKLWCAISGSYKRKTLVRASQIFPYRFGQDTMDAIFGRDPMEPGDLFSTRNGMLMDEHAEAMFHKGFFVIVPLLSDNATKEDIQSWHQNEPKRYKIRVVDRSGKGMEVFFDDAETKRWYEIDNQEIHFPSLHRPRARYLYFHYCTTMLRRSWIHEPATRVLKDELGKRFWGTAGPYLKKNMLLGFVEEMGHDFEALLEGAIEEDDDTSDPTALAVVSRIGLMLAIRSDRKY